MSEVKKGPWLVVLYRGLFHGNHEIRIPFLTNQDSMVHVNRVFNTAQRMSEVTLFLHAFLLVNGILLDSVDFTHM